MIRRINLYGAPGSGKSTCAAYIYSILKRRGFDIELVTEAIKPSVYKNEVPTGFDQLHLFSKQLQREESFLRYNVQLIVTDSPLYLNTAYADFNKVPGAKLLEHFACIFDRVYPSLNLYCVPNFKYNPKGRFQTSDQATKFDQFLWDYVTWRLYGGELKEVDPASFDVKWLIDRLQSSSPSLISTQGTSTEPATSCSNGFSPSTTSVSSCTNTKE